jgi:hypothetical protein
MLCAMRAPLNHVVARNLSYNVEGRLGAHIRGNDSLRHWVHWRKTELPDVLYNPLLGYRREAEWDDHAETYPQTWEGPDLWVKIEAPAGVHRVSTYIFNKDGHSGHNRFRDYLLEMKAYDPDVKRANSAPALAKTRVRDFWGGVYKSFHVRGPGVWWLKIGKDNSYNTILPAVFIDRINAPVVYSDSVRLAMMGKVSYDAPPAIPPAPTDGLPTPLFDARILEQAQSWEWKLKGSAGRDAAGTEAARVLALRALADIPPDKVPLSVVARWRWHARQWTTTDRQEWREAITAGRDSFVEANPHIKDIEM